MLQWGSLHEADASGNAANSNGNAVSKGCLEFWVVHALGVAMGLVQTPAMRHIPSEMHC